jgi:DNA topoisomerase-1
VGLAGKGKRDYTLRASGSILTFDGWMKLFPNREDVMLPAVEAGTVLDLRDIQAAQKFTQPPARFNDASLIKTLEKLGIGRPSTYASIISVILDRGYVERKEKAFLPSVIGITVSDFLVKYFPTEMDYQFTAGMEDDLDAIARGEKAWTAVLKTFYGPFDKNVKTVTKDAERAKIPVEKIGEHCPLCKDGELVIRTGRFGKFISCSLFPACKYTAKYLEKVDDMKCPDCKIGDVIVKRTKRGKPFFGCSRYPECKFASWKKPVLEGGSVLPAETAAAPAATV